MSSSKLADSWKLDHLPLGNTGAIEVPFSADIIPKIIHYDPLVGKVLDKELMLLMCCLGDMQCAQPAFERLGRWCMSRKNREGISIIDRIVETNKNEGDIFHLQPMDQAVKEVKTLDELVNSRVELSGILNEVREIAKTQSISLSIGPGSSTLGADANDQSSNSHLLAMINKKNQGNDASSGASSNTEWIAAVVEAWKTIKGTLPETMDWKDYIFLTTLSLLQLSKRDPARVARFVEESMPKFVPQMFGLVIPSSAPYPVAGFEALSAVVQAKDYITKEMIIGYVSTVGKSDSLYKMVHMTLGMRSAYSGMPVLNLINRSCFDLELTYKEFFQTIACKFYQKEIEAIIPWLIKYQDQSIFLNRLAPFARILSDNVFTTLSQKATPKLTKLGIQIGCR